jgi:hypothetical protein
VVGDTVEISIGTKLIRAHKVKHDRTCEQGDCSVRCHSTRLGPGGVSVPSLTSGD